MWHSYSNVEARFPGLVEWWLLHHLNALKLDHLVVYDMDGSFREPLEAWIYAGRVTYVGNFPDMIGFSPPGAEKCKRCLQVAALNHCMSSQRRVSEWILKVHSIDGFFSALRPLTLFPTCLMRWSLG